MIDEHIVEEQPSAAGWMVFSCCEGEEPQPVAFFMGRGAKKLAEELIGRVDADGEPVVFDAGIAPAVLVSDGGGGLFASNHFDDIEGKDALIRAHGSVVGPETMALSWLEQDAAEEDDEEDRREAKTLEREFLDGDTTGDGGAS